MIYLVSTWIESYTIIDTSSIALTEEPFVFNNIKEKAVEVVEKSKNCDDLQYNLAEYKTFAENYAVTKNFQIDLSYFVSQPCNDNTLTTSFDLTLKSPKVSIRSKNFIATK